MRLGGGQRLQRALALPRELARLPGTVDAIRRSLDDLPRLLEILQVIHDDEAGNRRRLDDLRSSAAYEAAFSERRPLISVVIPTYVNWRLLRDRAIPSVLAQTYQNFEIVIVGDCAPPDTAEVVASFNDTRIVYDNLPVRGPYPDDDVERWNTSGSIPFNAAVRRARGQWIAPFADDDALQPYALETVLDVVQRERYELCYGVVNCILDDGRELRLGEFPPRHGGFMFQGGLYHHGLRFIEHMLSDALFGIPNDWGLVRRMLRAGVRFGFVDEVLADYYARRNPLGFYPAGD